MVRPAYDWTRDEDIELRRLFRAGETIHSISDLMSIGPSVIMARLRHLGLRAEDLDIHRPIEPKADRLFVQRVIAEASRLGLLTVT